METVSPDPPYHVDLALATPWGLPVGQRSWALVSPRGRKGHGAGGARQGCWEPGACCGLWMKQGLWNLGGVMGSCGRFSRDSVDHGCLSRDQWKRWLGVGHAGPLGLLCTKGLVGRSQGQSCAGGRRGDPEPRGRLSWAVSVSSPPSAWRPCGLGGRSGSHRGRLPQPHPSFLGRGPQGVALPVPGHPHVCGVSRLVASAATGAPEKYWLWGEQDLPT